MDPEAKPVMNNIQILYGLYLKQNISRYIDDKYYNMRYYTMKYYNTLDLTL